MRPCSISNSVRMYFHGIFHNFAFAMIQNVGISLFLSSHSPRTSFTAQFRSFLYPLFTIVEISVVIEAFISFFIVLLRPLSYKKILLSTGNKAFNCEKLSIIRVTYFGKIESNKKTVRFNITVAIVDSKQRVLFFKK